MNTDNTTDPLHIRIIRICGLYVFPIIIVALLTILFIVPTKKELTPAQIDEQIRLLEQERARIDAD